MYNHFLSAVFGFIALSCVVVSYFLKKKSLYLFLQALAILFLGFSYLFITEYFAMITMGIGITRVVTYLIFEKINKPTPIIIKFVFAFLFVLSYFIFNVIILHTSRWIDIMLVVGNIGYTFAFGVSNLRVVRYLMFPPNCLVLTYNILVHATSFVIISYSFEVAANVLSIIKYDFLNEEEVIPIKK